MSTLDQIPQTDRVQVWSEVEYDAFVHAYILPDGQEMIFFHLETFRMSKEVLKSMKRAWEVFRAANTMPLFVMQDVETPSHRRLVEMFGFKHHGELPCTDGKTRNIFIHIAPPIGGPSK